MITSSRVNHVLKARSGSKVEHMAAGEMEERDGRRLSDGWRYCSVCRRNHDQGRKHIFTKQHKSRLSVLMSKFTKKVAR